MSRIAIFAAPGIGCAPVSHRTIVRFVVSNNSASAGCVSPSASLAALNSGPVILANRSDDGAERGFGRSGTLASLLRRLPRLGHQISARRDVRGDIADTGLTITDHRELKRNAGRTFAGPVDEIRADVHLFHRDNMSPFGVVVNGEMQ